MGLQMFVTTHTFHTLCCLSCSTVHRPALDKSLIQGNTWQYKLVEHEVNFMEPSASCPAVLLNLMFSKDPSTLMSSITSTNGKVHLKCGKFCRNLFSFSRLAKRLNFFVAPDKGFLTRQHRPPIQSSVKFKSSRKYL